MNEKLNLIEILKDCPKGTKLYSTIFGDVKFQSIDEFSTFHPISVETDENYIEHFSADGRYYFRYNGGECVLFPSKGQRNWSKFKSKKPKFDPKTLQPYDKVLVRNYDEHCWECKLYSHEKKEDSKYKYVTTNYDFKYCIPYNEDTKHLVGTKEEAPEFYRYWED